LPPQKTIYCTIDHCFLEVATEWKLLTEDYVMGVAHIITRRTAILKILSYESKINTFLRR